MYLLVWLQIVVLTFGFLQTKSVEASVVTEQYVVTMYSGIPPEMVPEKFRKDFWPENILLTANVDSNGRFHAEGEGMMFEGILTVLEDGKIDLNVNRSQLYTTSCFPIATKLKLNEAANAGGCAFSSAIFLYYFRVTTRKNDDG